MYGSVDKVDLDMPLLFFRLFLFYWSVAQLKPTNSYEYHPTRPPRSSSGGTQTKSPTHVVVGNLLVDSSDISGSSSKSSNSFFDVSPDIPSPPVPPPRTNLTQKVNSTSTPVKNNIICNNLLSLRDNVVALPIVPKKSLFEVNFFVIVSFSGPANCKIDRKVHLV